MSIAMGIDLHIRTYKPSMRRHLFKTCNLNLLLIVLISLFPISANARNVTLAWNADQAADGYKIYYKPGEGGGRNLENYNGKDAVEGDSPIDVGRTTEFTLHGLADNKKYAFVLTAYNDEGLESSGSREIQVLGPGDIPAPYNMDYNVGWRITVGNLQGFTVFYHDSNVIIPTLGSSDDIPALRQTLADVQGAGVPLNLQPSGTHFSPPVTLLIPLPGYSDVSSLDLYYYDDTRGQWFLAHDPDDPGIVQPEAVGWMVPGSRVNHNSGNPPTIEIRVTHFSGVQAGVVAGSQVASSGGGAGGGGGGCFISAITERRQ
jgi:hypothetical protein